LAGAGSASATGRSTVHSRFGAANRCLSLRSVARGDLAARRIFFKPTRLGSYMLYDHGRSLLSAAGDSGVVRGGDPGKTAEWNLRLLGKGEFTLGSAVDDRLLTATSDGALARQPAGTKPTRSQRFGLVPAHGCKRYPEARAGAQGKSFRDRRHGGHLFGFADAHVHITADMRAGGNVIYGKNFARFGITRALGGDAGAHGPDGSLDVTGNLLRSGNPVGTHDTQGWPNFTGWPVFDTYTHQQTYYQWLKRSWKAGERMVVAQTVEDEPLCMIEPLHTHSCDETDTIELEVHRLRRLERYVDAQSGGPGRGWFRLVRSPHQARRVIGRGKLAVLIGVESSDPFGCSESMGQPQCTRADVDRGIRRFRRWGIRSMFIAHWIDNAFAGAALEGGDKGTFISAMQEEQTGQWFTTGPCPEKGQGEEPTVTLPDIQGLAQAFPALAPLTQGTLPVYPPGKQCNSKGLTKLGAYLVRRLIANHMLIEVDHLSELARLEVLKIAERHHYPLVSSHTGTGGFWTPSDLRRLYALGGFATATLDNVPALAAKILHFKPYRQRGRFFGVGIGTDTGGFNSLPGPPAATSDPLHYPFHAYLCSVKFSRERTGTRSFDLNKDGVAHYGLIADLLAEMGQTNRGKRAEALLFRSAEAYLEMWQRVTASRG
jgi:microsomal dipeptidase-like Zn-dependent dipeptidase